MRIFLMLLGAAICGGALLVWIWLNGMAAAWNTGGGKPSIQWFTRESIWFLWLPVAVGIAVAVIGWRRG